MIKKFRYVILFYVFIFCNLLMLMSLSMSALAKEDSGIEDNLTFHVFDDVDLVSTLKFDYGKSRIVIKSVYPQLASETNREGVNHFNEISLQIIKDEVVKFKNKVKDNALLQKNLEKNKITNNLYIDYNASYVKSKKHHIISIRFGMQGFIAGNSRAYHEYRVLNYDLDDDKQIQLNELFLADANFLNTLSQYTNSVLFERLANKKMIVSGTLPSAENFSNWNIKPNGLVITFNDNQVAPAVFGAQTVLVPYSELSEIISPDSVVADCMLHSSRCARNNLLTGGFIDEA